MPTRRDDILERARILIDAEFVTAEDRRNLAHIYNLDVDGRMEMRRRLRVVEDQLRTEFDVSLDTVKSQTSKIIQAMRKQ